MTGQINRIGIISFKLMIARVSAFIESCPQVGTNSVDICSRSI